MEVEMEGPSEKNSEIESRVCNYIWCRGCAAEASEDCVDSGHVLCSFRKRRRELAEALDQQLQRGTDRVRGLVQLFGSVETDVQLYLAEARGRLQLLEEARLQLLVLVDEKSPTQDARSSLREAEQRLVEVQRQVSVAWPSVEAGTFQLTWAEEGSGSGSWNTWQAAGQVAAASPRTRHLLQLLVLQLHEEMQLTKLEEAAVPEFINLKTPAEDPYVSMPINEIDDLLALAKKKKVKKLKILGSCDDFTERILALLRAAANHIEELTVIATTLEHLKVVQDMVRLRKLTLYLPTYGLSVDLPLQLEELEIVKASGQLLQATLRMPALRRLAVHRDCAYPVDVVSPPCGPCSCVEWLRLEVRPLVTALALVRAHAATLRDLEVSCSPEDHAWHIADLGGKLAGCGLRALQRLTLRRCLLQEDSRMLPHSDISCQRQLANVRRQLGGVEVACSHCSR